MTRSKALLAFLCCLPLAFGSQQLWAQTVADVEAELRGLGYDVARLRQGAQVAADARISREAAEGRTHSAAQKAAYFANAYFRAVAGQAPQSRDIIALRDVTKIKNLLFDLKGATETDLKSKVAALDAAAAQASTVSTAPTTRGPRGPGVAMAARHHAESATSVEPPAPEFDPATIKDPERRRLAELTNAAAAEMERTGQVVTVAVPIDRVVGEYGETPERRARRIITEVAARDSAYGVALRKIDNEFSSSTGSETSYRGREAAVRRRDADIASLASSAEASMRPAHAASAPVMPTQDSVPSLPAVAASAPTIMTRAPAAAVSLPAVRQKPPALAAAASAPGPRGAPSHASDASFGSSLGSLVDSASIASLTPTAVAAGRPAAQPLPPAFGSMHGSSSTLADAASAADVSMSVRGGPGSSASSFTPGGQASPSPPAAPPPYGAGAPLGAMGRAGQLEPLQPPRSGGGVPPDWTADPQRPVSAARRGSMRRSASATGPPARVR